MTTFNISPDIFRAYDIRGIAATQLSAAAVSAIAQAYAARCRQQGVSKVAVGRDGRLSGADLALLFITELNRAGINVVDVGQVTTPLLYFAALKSAAGSGVMITGSHNPPAYNGFKLMMAGKTLAGAEITDLKELIKSGDFAPAPEFTGKTEQADVYPAYRAHISGDIHLQRPLNIIIDAGNGIAGKFAGDLYRTLGCQVTELYCEVDGSFPHHHPDPAKPENLQILQQTLKNQPEAELGLAFDGDGDRLGIVTKDGKIIWPDRLLMLLAADVLSRCPGAKIIYDVKCTRLLEPWIKERGGIALLSKTGHSYIKAGIEEHQAMLAGEMSGHIFFKERWFGFDDGLYAGARVLEILARYPDVSAVLNNLPEAYSTPEINIPMHRENENQQLVAKLQQEAKFSGAQKIITIDGLRIEYADGFGLIRASNTAPNLVLRFEADNDSSLERIKHQFRTILSSCSPYSF